MPRAVRLYARHCTAALQDIIGRCCTTCLTSHPPQADAGNVCCVGYPPVPSRTQMISSFSRADCGAAVHMRTSRGRRCTTQTSQY